MRNSTYLLLFVIALSFALHGCGTSPSITPKPTIESALSTLTIAPIPIGKTIVVISAEDSGPGTLREAIKDANPGDTIEFDISNFPPDQPEIIYLQSQLTIHQENLTVDATHIGVILDGSNFPDGWYSAFQIYSSNNTVRGLQLRNFPGGAIYISSGQNNLIIDNVIGGCDDGVSLGGPETLNNIITGNYIGVRTDGETSFPNRNNGITVGEGAHDNQIGPDNVIAFNDQFGILFPDSNNLGNTIVQNSIHNNGWGGINLFDSNNGLNAPSIIDFDLEGGTLTGTVCKNCTVEIFSDDGRQGAIFEGQTKPDENGLFSFNKHTAFNGPYLTSIATDTNGNSSEFSKPSVGLRGSSVIQDGNDLPKTKIMITPYQELADNRIGHLNPIAPDGDGVCPPVEENYRLLEHLEWGTKWLLTGIDMGELDEQEAWGDGWYSRAEITEYQDCTISLLVENGVTLVTRLNYWDEVLHAENQPDYRNEQEVQLFLDHNRFLVRHFKGRIQYYGILNEPNLYVEVEDYINLIRQVIPIIREEDPEAKIVVGEVTALDDPDTREYLFEILRSDIMPDVDAISIHPMVGTSPQYDEIREYYYDYPSLVQEIKDTATAHGFSGDYMATELGWGTLDNVSPGFPWVYTYTVAAKYYARGIVMNLGMNVIAGFTGVINESDVDSEYPVGTPFITRTIRNLSDVMAGTKAIDFPIEILSEFTNIKSYSFSLPNDEILIALWTDGAAVDDDPGIPSTLIIPGYSGFSATGIDVLFSFEQELISNSKNSDLVISDCLLKDYPIFIRLSK
ncbi:MAG: right-handed parallel beta-helix repeat-containing protein [Anaerolineaceae bacterium]|nr:right-handed parallel beta-helix repeat-containing protein [Anaerolineaceae bacterium]